MESLLGVLRVIHVANAALMAWPLYALVAVNNRGQLGPPLGDRADTYMENIIKNRTIPCFIFQGTALASGLALILWGGFRPDALITNPVLGTKFFLLLVIAGLLSYVHFSVQPAIDRSFVGAGNPITGELAAKIQSLRLRRKRIASICLFSVLTMIMLGMQVRTAFPLWLTVLLIVAIALFARRAYASLTPYGWV